jgi:NlpC/P60 family putative phage cell wall peptidase
MNKREKFINEAREWINTPFHHQGRAKGRGCDCLGLVLGSANKIGINPYNDSIAYSHRVHSLTLIDNLRKYLTQIKLDESKPGDILLFLDGDSPVHLGIITDKGFIHSYAKGPRKVVEQPLTEEWKKKIALVFQFKEIDNGTTGS